MIRPIGLDLGNAEMNLVGPSPDVRLAIPHAVVYGENIERPPDLISGQSDPFANLHALLRSPSFASPQKLIVGELATREYSHELKEREEGEVKAQSLRHLSLALVALAAAAQQSTPVGTTARLAVAVALPIVEMRNEAVRKAIEAGLRQDFEVNWLSTPGWVGRKTVVSIEMVDTVPEAAAGYLSLAHRNPALQNETVIVTDVGAGSLDWAVFAKGKFQAGLSSGTAEGGIGRAADRILTAVHSAHGPHVGRHRTDVLNSLRAGATQGDRRFYLPSGKVGLIDITNEVVKELDHLAKQIRRHIVQAVRDAGHLDRLLLIGGGGALIAPHLQNEMSDVPFSVAPGAEWTNAEGLYLRAQGRVAWREAR